LTIYDGDNTGTINWQCSASGTTGNVAGGSLTSFIGSSPLVGALVTNGSTVTNGANEESDPALRARLKIEAQSLSTGNIDAATSKILTANSNGDTVQFSQLVEDPSPTLPSIFYIDDGSGIQQSPVNYTGNFGYYASNVVTLLQQPTTGDALVVTFPDNPTSPTTFTFVSGAPSTYQIQIGGSVNATATNIATALASLGSTALGASAASAVITITAGSNYPGSIGSKIYLTSSSATNFTFNPTTGFFSNGSYISLASPAIGGESLFYISASYLPIYSDDYDNMFFTYPSLIIVSGNTTSGSSTISSISITGLKVGMSVIGGAIPLGARIISIGSSSIVISSNATATASGLSLSIGYQFSNVSLELNGTFLTQGYGANQYLVNPDNGTLKLNTPLNGGDILVIPRINYYDALIQQVNWQLYGVRSNRTTYRGITSLGSWVQVRNPSVSYVSVQGNVILDGTVDSATVIANIKQNMINYINNLGIGVTVLSNKLLALGFVQGVQNFTISSINNTSPTNIILSDGQLARTTLGDLIIS
jgi:hypothetical protein